MTSITFDPQCYRIDGRPVYLNSGEFHYFRVPYADWRRRMRLFKEAGGNCLATYCPWLLHEPREGQFEFGPRPGAANPGMLDLEAFLRMAGEEGLYVIARPGPYQYSELANAGLPTWLVENYPQLMAKRLSGEPLGPYSVSYIHDLLLEKTRRWFDHVCPIIAKYTASRGGPVAFVQLDNELTGVHLWRGGPDYNAQAMGFGRADGRYPRFLQNRYGTIQRLNEAYATEFTDFAAVRPTEGETWSLAELRRIKDYFEFYLSTIADFCEILAGWVRGHGIDVPLVHNSANANMNSLFEQTVARLGRGDFLLGSDHYYNLEGHHNPTPEYAIKVFYSCQMLRNWGYPPTVFELPSGQNFDYPPVLVEDEMAAYMTNVAFGMKGHNYYIYTGGPNPPGAGTTDDVYDFNAPIGADGEIRPLYHTQKQFAQFLLERPPLLESEREFDFRVALDHELPRCPYYWKRRGDVLVSGTEAWEFATRGLLMTAFSASLSPALCDLNEDAWAQDTRTAVVAVCSSSMPRAAQERLVRFLSGGGRLMIAPVLPTLDENFRPCTVLADFLGVLRMRRSDRGPLRVAIGEEPIVVYGANALATDNVPASAQILGRDEHSSQPLAWLQQTPAAGRALLLALRWRYARRHHEKMLDYLMRRLDVGRKVACSNPCLWTSLRTAGGRSWLFLINLYSGALSADVSCQPSWSRQPIDTGRHTVGAMSVKVIDLGA